jgi:hypothetical protein
MGHSFLYARQNTGLLWHSAVRPFGHDSYDNKENENAQKAMEHISENVDDNDKQQPLERNKVNLKENDWIVVVYSYFVLRRQYIAGNSTIRSLCIFALD